MLKSILNRKWLEVVQLFLPRLTRGLATGLALQKQGSPSIHRVNQKGLVCEVSEIGPNVEIFAEGIDVGMFPSKILLVPASMVYRFWL